MYRNLELESFHLLFFIFFSFIIHFSISLARLFIQTLEKRSKLIFLLKRATLCTLNSLASLTCLLVRLIALHTRSELRLSFMVHSEKKNSRWNPEMKKERTKRTRTYHTVIKSHNWVCFEHPNWDEGRKVCVYVNAFISATIAHTIIINKHSYRRAFNAYRIFGFPLYFIVFAVTPRLFFSTSSFEIYKVFTLSIDVFTYRYVCIHWTEK